MVSLVKASEQGVVAIASECARILSKLVQDAGHGCYLCSRFELA